ncbi:MAG: hypothetical protein ACI9XK_002049 [Granulosicoccus sp.]|jgi:hypothetical protein
MPFVAITMTLSAPQYSYAEQSDDSALIQLRGQHAISALFGLPAVAARPVQTREWQFSFEHSNQYMGGSNEEETLLLDGETSELIIRHRQRLGACVQLEAVVPFIQHSGGSFDKAIDKWHRVFGLPDANRSNAPYGALNYTYADSNGVGVRLDSAQSGIGDIQVSVQRSLGCYATADSNGSESIVRLGLKLPTGALEELRGSGEFDLFADIQSPVLSKGEKWRFGAAIGALYLGQADLIAEQNTLVAYGTFGAQYVLTSRYRLLTQLDWHTPFFQSELTELGSGVVSLSAGVRFLGPADQTLELTISEDVAVDTTPDIVAKLSWTYRPSGGR